MRTTAATAATAALLSLPLLAAGARHGHNHGEVHGHGAHGRALEVSVVTVTEVVTVTLTTSRAPQSSTPALPQKQKEAPPTTPSVAPLAPSPDSDGNPYQLLVPVAGSASVKNSCDYPVYLWSEGHKSCEPGVKCEFVAANSTYTEKMRTCKDGGVSLKISKTEDLRDPMQFEYSVWTNMQTVSYDISYLNCMKNDEGQQDLSACVGHEGGIQAAAGEDCPGYHCKAGTWCDKNAYVVAEFGYQDGAPVGACDVEKGIAFELCAGNRQF